MSSLFLLHILAFSGSCILFSCCEEPRKLQALMEGKGGRSPPPPGSCGEAGVGQAEGGL